MKFGTKMKLLWRILYKITTIYNDATASDVDCNQNSGEWSIIIVIMNKTEAKVKLTDKPVFVLLEMW